MRNQQKQTKKFFEKEALSWSKRADFKKIKSQILSYKKFVCLGSNKKI